MIFFVVGNNVIVVKTGDTGPDDGIVIVLDCNQTSPSLNALPCNVAPVSIAICDVPVVKIFPSKTDPVPSVAVPETAQKTFFASAPPIK